MDNPIVRAAKAAYSELSSPDAIIWYQETAHQAYLIAATLVTLAVILVEDWLLFPQEFPAAVPALEPLALPFTPIAGLLPPARPATPIRQAGRLASEDRVLVTPAPALAPTRRRKKPKA